MNGIHNIKILGTGCKSCHALYENAKKAVSEASKDIDILYITDISEIMTFGAMSMPAVVINDTVVSMGKVLKVKDFMRLFEKYE